MKGETISRALNMLDEKYISELEVFAPMGVHTDPERRKMKTKRIFVIALAAVLLLGLGAAAYAGGVFDLDHMRLEDHTQPSVSTAGYEGSVLYNATGEWNEYINRELLAGTYDEEAAEAVKKEIAKKYGLKIPSWSKGFSVEEFYEFLSCEEFLPGAGDLSLCPAGVSYEQGGSFNLSYVSRLPNGKDIVFDMFRYDKEYLVRGHGVLADTDVMEKWVYTCSNGTQLHIGMGETKSIMAAELEDCFVFILVRSGSLSSAYDFDLVDKADLENFAEGINFEFINSIDK